MIVDGTEVLLSSGTSQQHPIPPALEMVAVSGSFHVTNKRDGAEPNTLEFEVALEVSTEAVVLWSILHYDHGQTGINIQPTLSQEDPGHKVQIVPGMMPQIVSQPTVDSSRLVPLNVVRQSPQDKWRCRCCSLMLAQPGLPEEEMFKRLCALNEAGAKECKVCKNSIEAAGRCLWLDYARMPHAIKSHIDASDRWRPEASKRAIPPILHVVRTRWTGPSLRPGPLWPSKGGPSL